MESKLHADIPDATQDHRPYILTHILGLCKEAEDL